jgi:predicted RNA-binding protein YlxR (DUF448 family)
LYKRQPIRTCLSCKKKIEKSDLIRIIRNKENFIIVDESGKTPGRGAYICLSEECTGKAIKKKIIDKALRTDISKNNLKELKESLEDALKNKKS